MKILLDTHIFLWAISDPERLSPKRQALLEDLRHQVFVSAVSVTELMIKSSLGKLAIGFDIPKTIEMSGFGTMDFSVSDAMELGSLPWHHRDPFDRMLIAQAQNRKVLLMSDDRKFTLYDCRLI